jgi:hypothetical protein
MANLVKWPTIKLMACAEPILNNIKQYRFHERKRHLRIIMCRKIKFWRLWGRWLGLKPPTKLSAISEYCRWYPTRFGYYIPSLCHDVEQRHKKQYECLSNLLELCKASRDGFVYVDEDTMTYLKNKELQEVR